VTNDFTKFLILRIYCIVPLVYLLAGAGNGCPHKTLHGISTPCKSVATISEIVKRSEQG